MARVRYIYIFVLKKLKKVEKIGYHSNFDFECSTEGGFIESLSIALGSLLWFNFSYRNFISGVRWRRRHQKSSRIPNSELLKKTKNGCRLVGIHNLSQSYCTMSPALSYYYF